MHPQNSKLLLMSPEHSCFAICQETAAFPFIYGFQNIVESVTVKDWSNSSLIPVPGAFMVFEIIEEY